MASFGWIAGIHYCAHLSDSTTARFAFVLGMPWASTTAEKDPDNIPQLPQHVCESGFGDWLAPWMRAPVAWKLIAKDTADVASEWVEVVGTKVDVTLTLLPSQRQNLVDRCLERLHAHVKRHPNAMSLEPLGDEDPVFSYPLVSPGIAHLPAPLSDAVLGTSVVFEVIRTNLPTNATLLPAPVFDLADGTAKPTLTVKGANPGGLFIEYTGSTRPVGNVTYAFSGVVVNHAVPDDYKHDPNRQDARHGFLIVRSRTPDRQLYATLSRQFSPLRLWLSAIESKAGAGMSASQFCAMFVRLMGGGEDQLEGPNAVGSIYELVLPDDTYRGIFRVAHRERPPQANRLLQSFVTMLANDPNGVRVKSLLGAFAENLGKIGLAAEKLLVSKLAERATVGSPADAELIAGARQLYSALEVQQPSSRAGWSAWLAAVLNIVAGDAPAATVPAATEAILESAKAALRNPSGQGGPVVEDDVLRLLNGQIDYAGGFWEHVHRGAENIRGALESAKALYIGPIAQRVAATPEVRVALESAYDEAHKAVVQAMRETDPEADDPPLQLQFRSLADTDDETIRGCILALRIGVPRNGATEWKPGQWITSSYAKPSIGGGEFGDVLVTHQNAKAVFSDTQGSTQSDGLDEQTAVYSGAPLFAADSAESQSAGKPEVFRCVATDRPVPAVAYGARYQGISGTVDNAGVIIEPALRDAAGAAVPIEALADTWFETNGKDQAPKPFPYLSRRPPGSPVFAGFKDWGVTQDTLTFNASRGNPGDHRVAVLYSGPGYKKVKVEGREEAKWRPSQEVKLLAPSVGSGFMARWLAADALVDKDDPFRWAAVRRLTLDEVSALHQAAVANERMSFTHPAVSEMELRVSWFAGDLAQEMSPSTAVKRPLSYFDHTRWMTTEGLKLRITQADSTDPALRRFQWNNADQCVDVVVPKGMQARLDALSLIPKNMVEGDNARLQREALVDDAHPDKRPYVWRAGDNVFATREPQVLWIESLPDVPLDADLFNFEPSHFTLLAPASLLEPQQVRLEYKDTQRAAHWIVGIELEQKRWQWSGYPVQFPAAGSVAKWLPLYPGARDDMPALPDAAFSTRWVAGQWLLERLVMNPVLLPAVRPAMHMGMVVRAMPRFANLLSDETLARVKSVHIFDHVRGVPRSDGKRLAPPVWSEAIPLPRTVKHDSMALVQSSRGNLVVLADPVYDTSDTGRFGGIAERLELDVVATWDRTAGGISIDEAGPNPIFHGAPAAGESQPTFEMDRPFGLTYDQVVGGRPAQTGVLVRPSKTQGRWTLAKCRLRRLVLPHLMLDAEVGKDQTALIELRHVDDGWIPQDFVLYSEQEIDKTKLEGLYTIPFPTVKGSFSRAYLVTWHRDRWAGAVPAWRPRVHLYQRHDDIADWTLKGRVTPYDNGVTDFSAGGRGAGAVSLTHGGSATVYRIDVSDFTESRWLTFIGSFEQEVPVDRTYIEVLQHGGGGFEVRTRDGSAMPVLGAKGDLRISLLLLFAPQLDMMRGRVETEGGELVGVYAASEVTKEAASVKFDKAILPCTRDLSKCSALVMQMQRINVQSDPPEYAIEANTWPQLVEGLFPEESKKREAILRLVPEYIGPLEIKLS